MNSNLSHNELIQHALLEALEELHDKLSKEEKDSLIMLYIQSDVVE